MRETGLKSAHCQGQEAENMEREKFQQKALKQTKQKKSKSAEFLMVKGDREATEGIGNPAFNVSSPDLSACQTAEKKVIRHDMPDRTLAAPQQKFGLPASAEPKGNEYGRNYFDPLMDEEINPRQCAMEVSREDDEGIFYNRLTKLFDESRQGEPQDESGREENLNSEAPGSSNKSHEIHQEASEATPAYLEEFQRYAQKNVILLGSSPLEQDLKFGGEGLNEYIPMSLLKTGKTFEKFPSQPFIADLNIGKKDSAAQLGTLTEVTNDSKGAAGPRWKFLRNSRTPRFVENEQPQPPQPLQIWIRCLRGFKDKAPPGSYVLKVSLLGRLGGCVLQWRQTEQLKTRTRPVRHNGNFYDVGLYFHENLYVVLPQKKNVSPGMAFLFELFLLRGTYACLDRAVGWAVFPLCDNNFNIVEGKFKCPLLRRHYDQKLSNFRKIEDLICLDLDHWLCNLYFQVIKLPLHLDGQKNHESHTRLSPEFPVCLMAKGEKAESRMDNTAGLSEKETEKNACASMDEEEAKSTVHSSQGSITTKIGPCSMDYDPNLLKEDLHSQGDSLTDHSVNEKSTVLRTGEAEDYSQDISYLEELEEHRFSVW
nr:uncharacterized protein LOC103222193 [Chlorocebus sabaeus]